jgi:hypothetical protein
LTAIIQVAVIRFLESLDISGASGVNAETKAVYYTKQNGVSVEMAMNLDLSLTVEMHQNMRPGQFSSVLSQVNCGERRGGC